MASVVTPSPLPIVVMLTSFEVGGTERQTVELVRRLDPRRFHVHVACFHRRGPLLAAMPEGVPIAEFPLEGFRSAGAVAEGLRFARWCHHIGAALVHTCDLYANIFGLPLAMLAGVPARIGSRREVLTGDKSRLQLAGQRAAYRTAHAVVANSTAAAAQLAREGVPAAKVRLIPNGVDLDRFAPPSRRRQGRRITMVANLRPEKGHDVLLDAAPRILAACPDAELVLAGDGPQAATLAARARALGVGERVRFLGRCDDVPALLAETDVFVLPSRSEALPNAVIEAMAAGLPVVATEVGGIPELVTHGVTGRLVQAGDAIGLADALIDLLAHPEAAAGMGHRARAYVEHTFGFDRLVGRVEELYLTTIGRRRDVAALQTAGA